MVHLLLLTVVSSLNTDVPRYVRGHATTLALVGMASCIFGFLSFWYQRANRRREHGDIPADQQHLSEGELAELGDESHHYRYTV